MICGEDNGAGTTFLGDVWVPSVAHFKIPLEGNPTRPDRPGDMYDAETVGAEKDSGPVTAVAINGIGIQVSFFLVKVLFLLEACFDSRTTDAQKGNSLHCTAENSLPLPNF